MYYIKMILTFFTTIYNSINVRIVLYLKKSISLYIYIYFFLRLNTLSLVSCNILHPFRNMMDTKNYRKKYVCLDMDTNPDI